MSEFPNLLIETEGPVLVITINRPQVRNALDRATADALARALKEFDSNPELRVGILTGAGGHFCAGADLKELASGVDYVPWGGDPQGPCYGTLSKPLIAAVSGYACAGGLGLALRCDMRVTDESAVFAVLSRRWGVPMSDGTTVRLPRLIGSGRALDMLLTARKVGASEALNIGLAERVVPAGQALHVAKEMARDIAAFPQIAMRSDRMSAIRQWSLSVDDALALELELAEDAQKREAQQGAKRFAGGEGRHGQRAT